MIAEARATGAVGAPRHHCCRLLIVHHGNDFLAPSHPRCLHRNKIWILSLGQEPAACFECARLVQLSQRRLVAIRATSQKIRLAWRFSLNDLSPPCYLSFTRKSGSGARSGAKLHSRLAWKVRFRGFWVSRNR
jgi:hypothetical protein